MRILCICCLLGGMLLAACSGQEKPEDVLSREKMTDVLIDIHIAESKVKVLSNVPEDSAQWLYKGYEKTIFKEHQIDSATFHRSYRYYLDNVDKLGDMYEVIIDSLNYREGINRIN